MARTWLSIEVELLWGRGEALWPYPGRTFAVGPSHTFKDLAAAINTAFARWDRAHLSEFTLANGTQITDLKFYEDQAGAVTGPVGVPNDMSTTYVAHTISLGDEFKFVFDFGDNWAHRCTVHTAKIDPEKELGILPDKPLPYWGGGDIPDQYGRSWPGDDGESPLPDRPTQDHPMASFFWPTGDLAPRLDMVEIHDAIRTDDAAKFRTAIIGVDIDGALQQIAVGAPVLLQNPSDEHQSLFFAITNRLTWRDYRGDQELADDLLARMYDKPLPGRPVPANLEMVSELLEGDPEFMDGGYLDLHSGEAFPTELTDPSIVGEDLAFDIDAEPDRFLEVERIGGREGWHDMAAFARLQRDTLLRAQLEQAIDGKGAFRAFRDFVDEIGLTKQWRVFKTDREFGRARSFLADHGIRAV